MDSESSSISLLTLIPVDTLGDIFSWLTSKERSAICSVNWLFESVALATSMKIYPSKYWLGPYEASPKTFRTMIIKQLCLTDMIKYSVVKVLGDYHLAVRVKPDDAELQYACAAGDLDVVIMMYSRSKITSVEYTHAFNMACASGNQLVTEYLLSLGYQNTSPHHGADYAAYCGHLKLMKSLLDYPNITTATYTKCIQGACERGHTAIIKYLIDSQKIDDKGEYQALHNAGYYGHLDVAKNLINEFGWGLMVVIDSAVCGRQMVVVSDLLYSKPLSQDDFDVLFRSACERGGKDMVDYLVGTLAPGLVIDYNNGLNSAFFGEKEDIADYLISLGAVDGPNVWGWHERYGVSYGDSDGSESHENDYVDF